jgi:hypothetical protein
VPCNLAGTIFVRIPDVFQHLLDAWGELSRRGWNWVHGYAALEAAFLRFC